MGNGAEETCNATREGSRRLEIKMYDLLGPLPTPKEHGSPLGPSRPL